MQDLYESTVAVAMLASHRMQVTWCLDGPLVLLPRQLVKDFLPRLAENVGVLADPLDPKP